MAWLSAAAVLVLASCNQGSDAASTTETGGQDTDTGPTGAEVGATDSSGDNGQADTGSESTGEAVDPVAAPPGGLRRLLAQQYIDSVAVLLGPAAALAAAPPDDASLGAFAQVAATESPLPPTAIDAYESSAVAIAQTVLDNRERLAATVPCVADGPFDDGCLHDVAERFGRLAWRRPLTTVEVDALADLGAELSAWEDGVGFDDGLRVMLLALLQAPDFIYLVEVGEPDPDGGYRRLTPYEMATRLSFFLNGHTPSASLLELAQGGGLDDADAVADVAWSLLDEPAAREQVQRFYSELLGIGDLQDKGKDAALFPLWSAETAASMRRETLRMVDHLVFDDAGSILRLLDIQTTFADDNVAAVYGIDAPARLWDSVPLPQGRAGVLTMPAFLAATSYPQRNSPTRRGAFIQDRLLCTEIPPPPPDVDATLPPVDDSQTLRQRLEVHMRDPSCASCHALTDPLGFAYEGFDAIGSARALDNGQPVDTTGNINGLGSFSDAAQLAELLVADPRVPPCLVDNLFVYALGFSATHAYDDGLAGLHDAFADDNFDFRAALVALTVSPLFSRVDEPK